MLVSYKQITRPLVAVLLLLAVDNTATFAVPTPTAKPTIKVTTPPVAPMPNKTQVPTPSYPTPTPQPVSTLTPVGTVAPMAAAPSSIPSTTRSKAVSATAKFVSSFAQSAMYLGGVLTVIVLGILLTVILRRRVKLGARPK